MSIECLEMIIMILIHIGSIMNIYHAKQRERKESKYGLAGTSPVFFFVLQTSYGVPLKIHASRLGPNRVRRTRISGFQDPLPLNERVGVGNDRSRTVQPRVIFNYKRRWFRANFFWIMKLACCIGILFILKVCSYFFCLWEFFEILLIFFNFF